MDMYFPVDMESAKAPVIIVAAASQSSKKVVGACMPVANNELTYLDFYGAAQHYLTEHDGRYPVDINEVFGKITFTIVRPPEHGRLVVGEWGYWVDSYHPDEGYLGKDRVEVIMSIGEDVIRVVYNLLVQPKALDQIEESERNALCPKGWYWIISGLEDGNIENSIENRDHGLP
ncbi:hypothetical protein FACS1894158_18270 [Betaproteobacteria bacterium]|nr:hypothetical protein FACS1894158_18270 [Betaproteobacteria bacterium]